MALGKEDIKSDIVPLEELSKENVICGIVIAGFAISVIYHYLSAFILGFDFYPYNTFLHAQKDRFSDFYTLYNASKELDPYLYPSSIFLPFPFFFTYLFTFFKPLTSLILVTITFIVFFITYLYKNIQIHDKFVRMLVIFILTFMSYPILFSIDRGSIEIWMFISLAFFMYFYMKGMDYFSVLFLSVAISFNFYSGVFAILFLIDKKYIHFLLAGLGSILLTIGSAVLLKGGMVATYKGLMMNLAVFRNEYLSGGINSLHDSISLYAPLKLVFGDNLFLGKFYCILAIVLFSIIVIFLFKYKLSTWKVVTLLMFSYILLPQISSDHKLITLFIPIILFLNTKEYSKFDMLYSLFFGVLLIPKNYFIISGDVNISVFLNPVIIIIPVILIFYEAITKNNGNNVITNESR